MSQKYFEPFKKIRYTFSDRNLNQTAVINIFQRSSFLSSLKENIDAFYTHIVTDQDTIEIIANRYYGDPKYNWIILLFNNIIDPFYSLPLSRENFEKFVVQKYNHNSISESISAVHHYELETITREFINGFLMSTTTSTRITSDYEVDYDTGAITKRAALPVAGQTIELDSKTITIDSSVITYTDTIKAISNYDYEDDLNEKKRRIKILRPELKSPVEIEFRKLMLNG